MQETYEPHLLEASAQEYWENAQSFEAQEDLSKEKFYCLSMLPYPSGELHMGHVRVYTIGDVITRYQLQKGKNVLQPMGWDAFGLPAENAAIERKLPPAEWTYKNIKRMRKQFEQMGFGYDWKREITTCQPDYYRWEQWLFLQLYKKGLAYKKTSLINWDPVDNTVLANEQVVNGRGWRSGAVIEQREVEQWFLKITDYAEELLNGLDTLSGWPPQVLTMQRNWIGRSEGTTVLFKLIDNPIESIEVYTTRPDTLMGVSYLAIAPEHPIAKKLAKVHRKITAFLKKCRQVKAAEAEMTLQEKLGIDTGLFVIHPITQKKIPVWIANFVVMDYGTGALMAVPAHDERDHEFALKYKLPIIPVIVPEQNDNAWDYNQKAYTGEGVLFNSATFDQLTSKQACKTITDYLEKKQLGLCKTHYRIRDWGISRQRYWGTPIPIIYCKQCGTVPVPEADLPIILPENLIPTGQGSPLAEDPAFYKTKCPQCGKAAKRETDTMDTFVESSWYYARYCSSDQDQAMLDDRAKYWTPVDQYVGGIEHAVMHLLYARFIHKVLRDLKLLNSSEPFTHLLTQGMVLKDGAKMSKSKGNVVSPQALVKKYGADTVRLFMMFAAPPELNLEWSDSGVEGAHRFLKKLWHFAYSVCNTIRELNTQNTSKDFLSFPTHPELLAQRRELHLCLKQANADMERLQFNTVVSACMKILNLLVKTNCDHPESKAFIYEGLKILLCLLAPITPHIIHNLWQILGYGTNILESNWPEPSNRALQTNQVSLVIQINGKLKITIEVPTEADQETIEKTVLNHEKIQQSIGEKKIKRIIIVPNRLVNIVV